MEPADQGVDSSANRYMVIPRTLSFIFFNDSVLLLKGAYDKKIWPGLLNGVGGHLEAGEGLLAAARREILEETGLGETAIPVLIFRGVVHINTGDQGRGIILFVFSGSSLTRDIYPGKEGDLEWWRLTDLPTSGLVSDVVILLDLILKADTTFFLKYSFDDEGNLLIQQEFSSL